MLSVENLRVEFDTRRGVAKVLDGVSFSVEPGETLGIVGESGCGKSMLALAIMGLVPSPPGRISGGDIKLHGESLPSMSAQRRRQMRGNEISMIFQEPMTSLNPVYTVGHQIAETVRLHKRLSRREASDFAVEMIQAVGIPAPSRRAREYPHQLSGGMRQRIMIGMALVCEPMVLIADEPTTALDVTVQAQVFDLLKGLQEKTNTAVILITHDMGVIAEMTDRVVVMYAGRVAEDGKTRNLLTEPKHPYSHGLINCVPHLQAAPSGARRRLMEIPGIVPPLTDLGRGCAFAPRCPKAMDICLEQSPPLAGGTHRQACWLAPQCHAEAQNAPSSQ